jgi:hypothetical protein
MRMVGLWIGDILLESCRTPGRIPTDTPIWGGVRGRTAFKMYDMARRYRLFAFSKVF